MNYFKFKSWEEAKQYAYPIKNKSTYYCFVPKEDESLPIPTPSVKGETPWRICQAPEKERGIYIEVTNYWVTITIQGKKESKKRDIPRKKKSVSSILYEAFK